MFTRKKVSLLILIGLLVTVPAVNFGQTDPSLLPAFGPAAPVYAAPGVDAIYTIIKDDHGQPTIQVLGEGAVVTLPDVKNGLGAANLNYVVDLGEGHWQLNANLSIDVGVTLNLSPATGVSDLQLRSDSNGLVQAAEVEASINYKTFVFLRALNGTINIDGVKIYSWDAAANSVDTNYSNGRAYILAKYASTMNIRNSDIGYLGSSDGESYGLSWRDQNLNDNEPFVTRVTGELINSDIHHNYYGIYTYQAHDMVFRGNKFHHNIRYGFDPHDYSHHVLVEDNVAYENGAHGFIISRGCEYFTFRNNKSYNNFDSSSNQAHGFMLDPGGADINKPQVSSSFNLLENNEAYGNEGFGLRVLGSRDNEIRNNNFHHNYMGISLDLESEANAVHDNQFNQNTLYGIHLRETSRANIITNNIADQNGQYGIYIRSNDNTVTGNTLRQNQRAGIGVVPISSSKLPINNQVTGNTITNNVGDGIYIELAQKNRFENNLITDNTGNGVELAKDAKQNLLLRNTIRNNTGFGISASGSQTNGNTWSQNVLYGNQAGGITLLQGANGNLAPPVLSSATGGQVNGTAKANATVEIYTDLGAQGQYFEGQTTSGGDGSFVYTNATNWRAGQLTAITVDSAGNASPFAPAIAAPDFVAPTATNTTVATPTATATSTPSPTATGTATTTPTATATGTLTPLPPALTPISEPTQSVTPTVTLVPSSTPTAKPTNTPVPTATNRPGGSPTATSTPVAGSNLTNRVYLLIIIR